MEIKASAKYIKISPTKIRLVVNLIRGLDVNKALDQLKFVNKLASKPISKLINSAIANAENNFELKRDNLYIKEIRVDEGPKMKRWMPKAFGRATPILKRMSHINLILGELQDSGIKVGKKPQTEEPIRLGSSNIKGDAEIKLKDKKEENPQKEAEGEKKVETTHGAEGGHGHAKLEGGHKKGFMKKLFQRKSG